MMGPCSALTHFLLSVRTAPGRAGYKIGRGCTGTHHTPHLHCGPCPHQAAHQPPAVGIWLRRQELRGGAGRGGVGRVCNDNWKLKLPNILNSLKKYSTKLEELQDVHYYHRETFLDTPLTLHMVYVINLQSLPPKKYGSKRFVCRTMSNVKLKAAKVQTAAENNSFTRPSSPLPPRLVEAQNSEPAESPLAHHTPGREAAQISALFWITRPSATTILLNI